MIRRIVNTEEENAYCCPNRELHSAAVRANQSTRNPNITQSLVSKQFRLSGFLLLLCLSHLNLYNMAVLTSELAVFSLFKNLLSARDGH